MSPNRMFAAILVCLIALVSGAAVGYVLGGLGICGMDLSTGVVSSSIVLAGALSAGVALLWPRAWWAGASSFSVTALLGVASGIAVREWDRALASGLCIVAAVVAAFIIRRVGHRGLKPLQ